MLDFSLYILRDICSEKGFRPIVTSAILSLQDEGWVIVIRNLSNSINAHELKKRFEVFGEILECRVLNKSR